MGKTTGVVSSVWAAFSLMGTVEAADCQKSIEEAVAKITSSGPVRVELKTRVIKSGHTVPMSTTDLVPPGTVRVRVSSSKATHDATIYTPGVTYQPDYETGAWQKIADPVPMTKLTDNMIVATFASPGAYYATSCSAGEFAYEFDLRGAEIADFSARVKSRDEQRRKMDEIAQSVGAPKLPVSKGTMKIDPQSGRPISFSHLVSGSLDVAQDYTLTYDPTLKIEIPSVP